MDQPQSNPTETLSEFVVVRRSDLTVALNQAKEVRDTIGGTYCCQDVPIIAPATIFEDEQGQTWQSSVYALTAQRDKALSDLVAARFNRTLAIVDDDLTPGEGEKQASPLPAVGKLASEVGSLVWAVWDYKRQLDREKALEATGFVLFYLEATLATLGMTMEQARQSLYKKLAKRYPNGYSNAAAKSDPK